MSFSIVGAGDEVRLVGGPPGRVGGGKNAGCGGSSFAIFSRRRILDVALSVTEMALSVWWSWQLADGFPRDFGALSRAGSADVLHFCH